MDEEKDFEKQEEQEKELQEEIEKFKKMEEETEEMIEEGKELDETSEESTEEEVKEEEEEDNDEVKEETEEEVEEAKSSEKDPEDKKINNYRKIFIAILIIIILLLIFMIVTKNYNKKHDNVKGEDVLTLNELKEDKKEVMNIDNKKDEVKQDVIKQEQKEKSYSKNYKKYENLKEKDKKKAEVIPPKNTTPIEKLDNIDTYEDFDSEIPKKFNLKDKLKLKVEDQKDYSLCWAFAANNAIETNYQLATGNELDLSEIYEDYMNSNYLFDWRDPHNGGNFTNVTNTSDYFGLAKETENEYKDYSLEESYDFLDRERNIYVDYSIDMPSIYKEENKTLDEISDEELALFRENIKYHIMNYGSLYAVVVGSEDKNNYSAGTDEDEWADHAVSIVGWDDTYSKNNFDSSNGTKPAHDGAYIVLNSWGESAGDKGYQYYSYDDAFIESSLVGVVSVTDKKDDFVKVDELDDSVKGIVKKVLNKKITKLGNEYVINPNAFYNLYSLDLSNLHINNNTLKEIVKLFPDVAYLNLSNNNLTSVKALEELYGLEYVDLTNNHISDVTPLRDLGNLNTIILDGNKNVVGYSNLKELAYISLNNCKLNKLEDVSDLPLTALSVSNNFLTTIGNVGNLNYIELNHNNISDVSFLSGNEYGYIDLANNKISNLNSFDNIDVATLVLDSNNITNVNLTNSNLLDLSINDNKITNIEKNDSVNILSASGCSLENFDLVKNYKNLNILVLDNNMISSLKGIRSFKDLDALSLNNNKITSIDEVNSNISYLSLAKNEIKSLGKISGYKDLGFINLNSTKVNDLTELGKMEKLSSIDIGRTSINNLEDIDKYLNKLDNIYLSLEGSEGVTGKVGDNVEGLNLEGASVNSVSLKGNNIYALNIDNIKGDFDVLDFITDNNNYYISGVGKEITENELNKYLETNYEIANDLDDMLFIGSTSGPEEDEDLEDDSYLYNSVYLDGFDVNYRLNEENGIYKLTDNNFRRYITNNYLYFDAPYIEFTNKFDGFMIRKTSNDYDLLIENNKVMFSDKQ